MVLITTLALQDKPQRYILSYLYRLVRALSLSRTFILFSVFISHIPPWLGKVFKFMVFGLLLKCICKSRNESRHFYLWSPAKNFSQVLITPSRQRKITHPATPSPNRTGFFQKSIYPLPTGERGNLYLYALSAKAKLLLLRDSPII